MVWVSNTWQTKHRHHAEWYVFILQQSIILPLDITPIRLTSVVWRLCKIEIFAFPSSNNCVICVCVQELCSTADVVFSGKKPDNQIRKGFEWLIDSINTNYDIIQKRVSKDSSAQKADEERDKKEKRDRVNKLREERLVKPLTLLET